MSIYICFILECIFYKYGLNCVFDCGYCKRGMFCLIDIGLCINGCEGGWIGDFCGISNVFCLLIW